MEQLDRCRDSFLETHFQTHVQSVMLLALLWNTIIVPEELRAPAPKSRQKRSRGTDE